MALRSATNEAARSEAAEPIDMEDTKSSIVVSGDHDEAVVNLSGVWSIRENLPEPENAARQVIALGHKVVRFDTSAVERWDSGLLVFLIRFTHLLAEHGVHLDRQGLPDGARSMLKLAETVPEREGARAQQVQPSVVTRIGLWTTRTGHNALEALEFVGSIVIAFGSVIRGRARFRRSDLSVHMQEAGVEALPIVTLISFLVGTILAFVGAVQLEQFGAEIYVANLVGIAMVREMGAMMTAIVMAGRTGAAYAAALGSMKVNQEIDALSTMGISPLEFLVIPRMIALALMMPLLCLYSDAVGILGGAAVGVVGLGLSPVTYYQYTQWAVTLDDLVGGLVKAAVYGVLVALFGCLRGIQSGSSSSAVGEATTRAVVSSIVAIISACGIFAVVFYVLGI
ncbi:MAG TPA: ABC transporter permease [Candidatus Limnocylindrales bacterium]|nr:ABC transporter permease [Candidatus Limnocylindrales bacterium]